MNDTNAAASRRRIILSGIQPTGTFTLGNYLGAVKNWRQLQEEYDCYYFVADLHALTVYHDPAARRKASREAFALLLACGLDPTKSLVFIQSHVPAHAQMAWMLSCLSPFGDLSRMTQFKDKSAKHPEDINAGLFTYPALMAGDILLYQADYVPVGADQTQHLEFTRNIAARFNHIYGETFRLPEGYFPKTGARVMSLAEPTAKMSKSDENAKATIFILDDEKTILKKFKSAVTDSEALVAFREGKDGINNLMTIYSAVTGKSMEAIADEFSGKGYGDFKTAVGTVVAEELREIRENYARLLKDAAYLDAAIMDGTERASQIAEKTLRKTMRKMGLV
ncbi:tryptophan--tRNA ligase [Selenomonas noxia]|jgi:tryptophan--tRNA ligase|uniref:Tryptophan--tRNA ligase n=1 Tax=Selenomonas noxia F0398 TaxID=702437 RepID=A0ABP2MPR4_9FIRM|nr:tryptophan--tRNA ligase [Selenomonas noxia]EHG24693.1 tryptophanyl-tRNA synthetase [Selenomonas noxia F0398]